MRRYVAILVALGVALAVMFCGKERKRFFSHEGVVWTTDYHITYEASRDLGDSIQLILNNLDMSVSPYNKASLISALNENKLTLADAYIKRLLEASEVIHRESGGAEFADAVLAHADELTRTAGLEILLRDLKTVARFGQKLQPLECRL